MTVIDFEEFKRKKSGRPEKTQVAPAQPSPVPAPPGPAYERLFKATRELRKAALRQGILIRKFRRISAKLGDEIRNLEASCIRFDRNIRRIRVNRLRRVANRLVDTMGSKLAAS